MPKRRAFTLVELLVVIAVIGVLIGLTMPALFATRSASRRLQCTNNLRQIGIALQAYHERSNRFPPGGIEWRPPSDRAGKHRQLAWSALLLPFVEAQAIYDQIDFTQAFDSPVNAPAAANILPVFVCPSSMRGRNLVDGRGPCDYGGIYGERIQGPNQPPKGSMIYDYGFNSAEIRDGLTNTIMIAEDTGWSDGQWINGRNLFDQAYAINAAPLFENDIRSNHHGGANSTLASGTVRFLTDETDLNVLAALCTRAGGEALEAF